MSNKTVGDMKEEDLRKLISEALKESEIKEIKDMLLHLGLDYKDYNELRKDFYFLRACRQGGENFRKVGFFTAIGTLVSAFMAAAWYGLTHAPK